MSTYQSVSKRRSEGEPFPMGSVRLSVDPPLSRSIGGVSRAAEYLICHRLIELGHQALAA